ncbi:hypothetical protein RBH39_24460 [Escherichia coli]|uniref:hypothetical protein n=1 Tax=Escherichia coli TaxID=562 RepID=UPI002FC82B89
MNQRIIRNIVVPPENVLSVGGTRMQPEHFVHIPGSVTSVHYSATSGATLFRCCSDFAVAHHAPFFPPLLYAGVHAGHSVCAPGMARSAVTGAVLQLWWLKND